MSGQQYTRTTRTVRVESADGQFYADVEILMAISWRLPNEFETSYNIVAPVDPIIVDGTGSGNEKDGSSASTRSSHMQRVRGKSNTPAASQFFDIEVCDAFTITGPNATEHVVNCPVAKAVSHVVDDVGAGLGNTPPPDTQTRCQHVVKYTQQISGATQAPFDNPTAYAYGLITDCMTFDGPAYGMPYVTVSAGSTDWDLPTPDIDIVPIWHEVYGLVFDSPDRVLHGALQPNALCNDLTHYVTDPHNPSGPLVPPPPDPKVDLNIYVYWPGIGNEVGGAAPTGTPTGGPFLGPATAAPSTDGYNGIDTGPIWWIRQLGTNVNVWYWYISPVQQPLAWSGFGDPPEGTPVKWGYRGNTLLPYFSVIWDLSVNYPLVPMGTYGAPDIATAAAGVLTDGVLSVNWYGLGIPDGTFAVSTSRDGTNFTLYSYYMPYGAFDLLGPSSAELLKAAAAAGSASIYTDYGGPGPNIWELTGIEQPPLIDPNKPWSATTNPHRSPTLALAQQVCETFVIKWNAVANAINEAMHSIGGDSVGGWPYVPPPGWSWAKPYGGDSVATAQMFNNGWVPGVLLYTVDPATVPTIATGQLDPAIWNNQPALSGQPPWQWATGVP